jgi:phage repressor protein C with HTH and peptisase S24 domain
METVGQRVRQVREAAGVSRKELERRTGIGYSTIAELERGGMGTSTKLRSIAEALRVNLAWLETGKGPKEPGGDATWQDIVGYGQALGLSEGEEAQEYAEAHKLKFRADSLARKGLHAPSLAVMYGRGDSMLPRIHDGDAILFDTSDRAPADESLFAVMVPGVDKGLYSVKRCRMFGDDVYFEAMNPAGDHGWRKPRKMADKRHPIEIIGRVRWIGSWED